MNHYERLEAERQAYDDWLAGLKVGDEVFVRGVGIQKVARMTDTQFILDTRYDLRYRRSTGRVVGQGMDSLCRPTEDLRQRDRANKNRTRLSRLCLYVNDSRSQLSDDHIAAMLKAYDEVQSIAPKGEA